MERVRSTIRQANNVLQSDEFQEFLINAEDFLSRRDEEGSASTQISQALTDLNDAAMVVNRSFDRKDKEIKEHQVRGRLAEGGSAESVNIISPVVIAKSHRSWAWVFIAIITLVFSLVARAGTAVLSPGLGSILFGWYFWILWLGYVVFNLWRNSYVMIPDGCVALITRFGKVIEEVGAGRHYILHPWNSVGYIVNVTREYPYNAPIREAPTLEQVNASVDLFLQFRINEPREFIFRLGGVNGFSEKLQNAISEQTRALIYSQRAEEIYDLIGESTNELLVSLNEHFMPAVEFVNANITHAEPSSQEYRMDLAAAEMVRVAKEAYNYQYELSVRKKRDEGDLDQELAGLRETLSDINADIATFNAQITTAEEKEVNRANAYAAQLMIEAESGARANVALFEAQALDIRALRSADYPEILEYRFQQDVLTHIKDAADKIPQIVDMGNSGDAINYIAIARQLLGIENSSLYTEGELAEMRERATAISKRVEERAELIRKNTTLELELASAAKKEVQ